MARAKDLTGRRFGRLLAEYPTDRRDHRGSVYWHCRCDCGNELDVSESSLMHGRYQSCGCLRKELGRELPDQLTGSTGPASNSSRTGSTVGTIRADSGAYFRERIRNTGR